MDAVTFGVLYKLIKSHATGYDDIIYNPTTGCIEYHMTDGTVFEVPLPDGGATQESITSTVTCGAVSVNDVVPKNTNLTEFAKKLLVKDLAPKITITSTKDNSKVYERGVVITPSLTVTVEKIQTTDGDIKEVILSSNPTDANFNMTDNAPNPTINTYTKSITISDTIEYAVQATNTKNRVGNKKYKYVFVNPTFYGVLPESFNETNVTQTDVETGTKDLLDIASLPNKELELKLTANFEKFFICYDSKYGELTSIKDVTNGFELISGCSKFNINITTVDGTVVNYYCYIAGTRGAYTDMPILFKW